MTETDKLLVRIGTARDAISSKTEQTSLDYMIDGVLMNCSVLLKEQQQLIWELQDQVEYLTDKQKEQKFLVDSDGKITPLPVVVRCKDCKHYDEDENSRLGTCLENGVCSTPDWFCADGERR